MNDRFLPGMFPGASVPSPPMLRNDYPTSDGKPMAETDWHRDLMADLLRTLQSFYQAEEDVYVSANLLLYYIQGDKRKRVAPDVFVVKGVPKHLRPNYLLWQEGKGPDLVIELTSSSTRHEDLHRKFKLYQNVLKVPEYFLFDPREDYLEPSQQGYRLRKGVYQPIRAIRGRLPSQVLGLDLERSGEQLRLYDPATREWLPTPAEHLKQIRQESQQAESAWQAETTRYQVETARRLAETTHQLAETSRLLAEAAQRRTEAENERLRREVEELRRRLSEDAGQ